MTVEGEARHNCGVAAVYLPKYPKNSPPGGAVYYLYRMLLQMQNRGQLAAGMTTYNRDRVQLIDTYKKLGTVNEAFPIRQEEEMQKLLRRYAGDRGIGHTRYATSGLNDRRYAQPFERHHGRLWKWFAFGFNGNLANYAQLRAELERKKYHMTLETDTEIIMHFISKEFVGEKEKDLREMFRNLSDKFDGAYNIVYMSADGKLAACRDPTGNRPLHYARQDNYVGVASETVGLEKFVDVDTPIKPIKPGEMLLVENGNVEVKKFAKPKKIAKCMFEWVYFANAASSLDGRSVYRVRWALGKELAKLETLNVRGDPDYVVVAVPDTAKPAADSYAQELGIPAMEGLLRNRYVGRTFIEARNRDERVKEKYNINKSVVKDKKVILVEDSIVRGTTTKAMIKYLKEAGHPKEIHVRVSCPPIKGPCFYGIDMSTMDELIAPKYLPKDKRGPIGFDDVPAESIEKIRKELGADSLIYQTISGLVRAIKSPDGDNGLCLACVNGDYPTPWGKILLKKAIEGMGKKTAKRTYEC